MPSTRTVPAIGWTRILVTIVVLILLFAVQGSAQTGAAGQAAGGATDRAMSAEAAAKMDSLQQEMAGSDYSFTVKYSPAMEYSLDQLCGLKEPKGWGDNAQFERLEAPLATVPVSFDWRQHGGVTPIKNQGGCGSCWAFGTVGPLESQIKLKCGTVVDLAEQYLVSCNSNGWNCDRGGWWAHDYHQDLFDAGNETRAGAVRESGFPYVADDVTCNGPHSHAYKLKSWGYIGNGYPIPSVQAIKQAIYTYGPIGVAVCAGDKFQGYGSGIFNTDEKSACGGGINHAVVLVGWNDDLGPGNGYWILRNSWGTWWGENGYMRIRYGISNVGYAANFVVLDTTTPPMPTSISYPSQDPDGTFTVSWTAVKEATRYTLQVAGDPSFAAPTTVYTGGGTHYKAVKMGSGSHYFRVRAVNGCTGSAWAVGGRLVVPPASIKVSTPNRDMTLSVGITIASPGTTQGIPATW